MGWQPLSPEMLGPLMRFLGTREACCTAFTEKLVSEGQVTTPNANEYRVIVRIEPTGGITGAILQSTGGLYYPVLDDTSCLVETSAVEMLRRNTRRIYSLMGRTQDVHALETAFRPRPTDAVDYYLMVQDSPPPEIPLPRLPGGIQIVRSTERNARALARIQRLYEVEEVLLPGSSFDAVSSLRHLQGALKTQMVIHAELGGRPVAKAGTNARGLFFDQIGGVFTEPELRSRGIGTALMQRLLALIAEQHKSAALFVKMDNAPALAMYKNLGFRVLDGFRISYYR